MAESTFDTVAEPIFDTMEAVRDLRPDLKGNHIAEWITFTMASHLHFMKLPVTYGNVLTKTYGGIPYLLGEPKNGQKRPKGLRAPPPPSGGVSGK